jgi:2-polyprenyl-6-methoxyphenol hydroxylase-like FAD-dependent oxidoreductase
MPGRYDAIIVGARCGGAPLAMLLARQGHRVLLVDRSHFPSDTMSTHYVKRTGAAFLRDWGLLDEIERIGTPSIRRLTMRMGDVSLSGNAPEYRGIVAGHFNDVRPFGDERRNWLVARMGEH